MTPETLNKDKKKIVESFVEECLKEYGRGKIGRIFATELLIKALDQYAKRIINAPIRR